MHAVLAHRRIDNQVEIAVGDHIPHVGTSLVELLRLRGRNPCRRDQIIRAFRGHDLKAVLRQASGHFHHLILILLVDGDQHSARKRQLRLHRFLRLEEGFAVRAG